MNSPFFFLFLGGFPDEVGLTSSDSWGVQKPASGRRDGCVWEQQTVKMGFLITKRLALCPGYHCCILLSLALCPIIFHPLLPTSFSLTEAQTEYITQGPTRTHSPFSLFLVCLCFHSIWLCTHKLKHTEAECMTKQRQRGNTRQSQTLLWVHVGDFKAGQYGK